MSKRRVKAQDICLLSYVRYECLKDVDIFCSENEGINLMILILKTNDV